MTQHCTVLATLGRENPTWSTHTEYNHTGKAFDALRQPRDVALYFSHAKSGHLSVGAARV